MQRPTTTSRLPLRKGSDPVADDATPLDEASAEAIPPTDPPVETALDDDEGGADPFDPDTGSPYSDKDPGAAEPRAERRGGMPEICAAFGDTRWLFGTKGQAPGLP